MTLTTKLFVLTSALLLAPALAACGGDDDSDATSTPRASGTTQVSATGQASATAAATASGTTASATTAPADDGLPNLTGFDACSLITTEDIAEVLSIDENSVGEGATTKTPPDFVCFWANSVRIDVHTGTSEEMSTYHAFGGDPVPNLGSDAGWFSGTRTLAVLSGNFDLTLSVLGLVTEPEQKVAAAELARRAIFRLP
jgi:hypothetical protein